MVRGCGAGGACSVCSVGEFGGIGRVGEDDDNVIIRVEVSGGRRG